MKKNVKTLMLFLWLFVMLISICACVVDKRSDAEKELDAIHESIIGSGNLSFEEKRQLDELHNMLDEAIKNEAKN